MLLLAANVIAEKYFVLDVNYIIGSVTFNSVSLREIDRAIKYNDKSGFLIKTISFDNFDIERLYYNMSENKNYVIYIPYDKNAARIEMYNLKNSKIMDIDVASFADTCGNGICEPYESYESCQKDCKSGTKDDFCDSIPDGICDPDCSPKTDADCAEKSNQSNQSVIAKNNQEQTQVQSAEQPKEKSNYAIWILLVSAIIIFILLFLFIKKIKENRIINSLKQYIGENIRKGFTLQQIKDALFKAGYKEKEVDKAIKAI